MQLKRSSVGRTGLLAAIAVAAMLMQLFPDHGGAIKWGIILLGLVYLLVGALTTYPRLYFERRRRGAQLAADEQEYRHYERELAVIRKRFSADQFAEDAALPPDYQAELAALNERHREVLSRKFGAY